MADTPSVDLAVIGGGPAGQAAAEIACAAGLSVAMIDEQARMGGQILRQPPASFTVAQWLPGAEYRNAKAQLARAEALQAVQWIGGTAVVGILDPDASGSGFVLALSGERTGMLQAQRVLIAAGCYDLPAALPNWTIPGVMSAGGVQAFIKSGQIVPGDRFVLAGTHPLQLIVADQIVRAGGTVSAVLFAQQRSHAIARIVADPVTAARHGAILARAAAVHMRLRRAGVPVLFGRTIAEVVGDREVAGARLALVRCGGLEPLGEEIPCDRIALCFGFIPQADLPRAAGCATRWIQTTGGWATEVDAWMRTSVARLYAAGETTGVAGAEVALEEGRIAGLAIVSDEGRLGAAEATARAAPHRRRLRRLQRFAAMLDAIASPERVLPLLATDDTLICRCEDVSRGTLARLLQGPAPPAGINALKLVSRAGMGLCQGRSCEHAILRLLCAEAGAAPDGGFTARFPVRPIPIADLID